MTIAANLRGMFPEGPFRAATVLTVIGLGDDDTSVVATDGVSEDTYSCSSGYHYRAVGDAVLAVQLAGGGWTILGKLGATGEERPPTLAQVKALIPDTPGVSVDWGVGAPAGTGWVHPDSMWLRTTATGDIQLYGQLAVTATAPTQRAISSADVTVSANSAGAWRESGSQDSDEVKAGSWVGSDWYGAWFFGNEIADACAGKSVASMKLTISRTNTAEGWNRGVPLHLALHSRTSRRRPSLSSKWSDGRLSRGEKRTITIPSTQRAKLASGDMKGLGVYGSGRGDYMRLSRTAKVTITFS